MTVSTFCYKRDSTHSLTVWSITILLVSCQIWETRIHLLCALCFRMGRIRSFLMHQCNAASLSSLWTAEQCQFNATTGANPWWRSLASMPTMDIGFWYPRTTPTRSTSSSNYLQQARRYQWPLIMSFSMCEAFVSFQIRMGAPGVDASPISLAWLFASSLAVGACTLL